MYGKKRTGFFQSISCTETCLLSLFTFLEISKNDLMFFDLDGSPGAFLAYLLLEFDVDSSLSPSEFLIKLVDIVSSKNNDHNSFFH